MEEMSRIVVTCERCELSMDVPNNTFGQAMRDQFEREHEGHS